MASIGSEVADHQTSANATSTPVETAADSQAVAGASATEDHATRSKPVELSNLSADSTPAAPATTAESPSDESKLSPPQHAPLNRSETAELALGPDGADAPPMDSTSPVLRINLMLTTGARHAYTISQKYLTSRKVEARDAEGNFDPREMSGYKLKELIWTDWRSEWEPRPRDPGAIRLIIMGRMIDDKSVIKDLPFALNNQNVVHMTVKPADLLEDEAEGAGKSGGKGSIRAGNAGEDRGAGCRCVIL